MELERQLAVGALDLTLSGRRCDAKDVKRVERPNLGGEKKGQQAFHSRKLIAENLFRRAANVKNEEADEDP
jgi:hypothetical protein